MLQRVMESVPYPPSPRDIRKAVLKLRWIGLEVEAEKLEQRLSDVTPSGAVEISTLILDPLTKATRRRTS